MISETKAEAFERRERERRKVLINREYLQSYEREQREIREAENLRRENEGRRLATGRQLPYVEMLTSQMRSREVERERETISHRLAEERRAQVIEEARRAKENREREIIANRSAAKESEERLLTMKRLNERRMKVREEAQKERGVRQPKINKREKRLALAKLNQKRKIVAEEARRERERSRLSKLSSRLRRLKPQQLPPPPDYYRHQEYVRGSTITLQQIERETRISLANVIQMDIRPYNADYQKWVERSTGEYSASSYDGGNLGVVNGEFIKLLKELEFEDGLLIIIHTYGVEGVFDAEGTSRSIKGITYRFVKDVRKMLTSVPRQVELLKALAKETRFNVNGTIGSRNDQPGYGMMGMAIHRLDQFRIYYRPLNEAEKALRGGCRDYSSPKYNKGLKELKAHIASMNGGLIISHKTEVEGEDDVDITTIKSPDGKKQTLRVCIPRTSAATNNCGLAAIKMSCKALEGELKKIAEDSPEAQYRSYKYEGSKNDILTMKYPSLRNKYHLGSRDEVRITDLKRIIRDYKVECRIVDYKDYIFDSDEDLFLPLIGDIVLIEGHYVCITELPPMDNSTKGWNRRLDPCKTFTSVLSFGIDLKPMGSEEPSTINGVCYDIAIKSTVEVKRLKVNKDSVAHEVTEKQEGPIDMILECGVVDNCMQYLDEITSVANDMGIQKVALITYGGYRDSIILMFREIVGYVEHRSYVAPGNNIKILDFDYKGIQFVTVDMQLLLGGMDIHEALEGFNVTNERELYEKLCDETGIFYANYCSIPSVTWDRFLSSKLPKERKKILNTNIHHHNNFIKKAIIGGRCDNIISKFDIGFKKELEPSHVGKNHKKFNKMKMATDPIRYPEGLIELDINSMYPSIMIDYQFPEGEQHAMLNTIDNIGNIRTKIAECKSKAYPYIVKCKSAIPPKGLKYVALPIRLEGGTLSWHHEVVQDIAICDKLFEYMVDMGYKIVIEGVMWWTEKSYIFKDYIQQQIDERNRYRVSNPCRALIAKQMANFLFGKTIQKPNVHKYEIVQKDSPKGRSTISSLEKNLLLEKVERLEDIQDVDGGQIIHYVMKEENARPTKPTYLGVFILHYAQLKWLETAAIIENGELFGKDKHIYYTDTDSFVVPESILPRLMTSGIIGPNIGQLKVEYPNWRIIHGEFIDKKLYLEFMMHMVTGDVKAKIRAKGILDGKVTIGDLIKVSYGGTQRITQKVHRKDTLSLKCGYQYVTRFITLPKEVSNVCLSLTMLKMDKKDMKVDKVDFANYIWDISALDITSHLTQCKDLEDCLDVAMQQLAYKGIRTKIDYQPEDPSYLVYNQIYKYMKNKRWLKVYAPSEIPKRLTKEMIIGIRSDNWREVISEIITVGDKDNLDHMLDLLMSCFSEDEELMGLVASYRSF